VADPTVESQVIELKNSGANVFFNSSTPKCAAQAIKKAAEIGWKPAHYIDNVSASIGAVIGPAGMENAQGIITAQYLKDASDPQWKNSPDMIAWSAFMDKYMPLADKKNSQHVTG
jgi:branched-chain amino acid transport system substrate-binding protein